MTDFEKNLVLRNQILGIKNNLGVLNSKIDELSTLMKSTLVINNRVFKIDELNNLKKINNTIITRVEF